MRKSAAKKRPRSFSNPEAELLARALSLLLLLLAVFAGSRTLIRLLPGDPVETLLAETGLNLPAETIRHDLGLDRPLLAALGEDLSHAMRGDLGRSLLSREPVGPLLGSRLGRTAALAASALALGLALSLALGLAAAGATGLTGRLADRACTVLGALSSALPIAWVGPMLMYLLAIRLPLVPVSGHLALPALTLGLSVSGLWCRMIRERVRETLRLGSARGARARGFSELRIVIKHGLIPSAGFLVAYLGTQAGAMLSGAFITEALFDWPGMGSLLVSAVLSRDYPVVEAAVFAGASLSLLGNLIGDWAQNWIDPRLSAREQESPN